MKAKFSLLFVVVLTFVRPTFAGPLRVLFIGNSYTQVNNLPQIVKEIAASAGAAELEVDSSTPGGKTLEQHLNLPATLKKIDAGKWDIVVIQGQSQEAAMAERFDNMRASFLKGVAGLYDRIKEKSPKARIVLYETWARHADYWKSPKADENVGDNPAEMQANIRKWYGRAAEQREHILIARVGDAWESNYKSRKPVRLHQKDNSHPTYSGSYLAGLVIYAVLCHPADLHVAYHGSLTDEEAAYLQHLAEQLR